MADAQLEDGHVRIPNRLNQAILAAGFNESQMHIMYALIQRSYGWNNKTVTISQSELAKFCGKKPVGGFVRALNTLVKNGVLLELETGHGRIPSTYSIQTDYERWGSFGVNVGRLAALWDKRPLAADALVPRVPRATRSGGDSSRVDPPEQVGQSPDSHPEGLGSPTRSGESDQPAQVGVTSVNSLSSGELDGRKDSDSQLKDSSSNSGKTELVTREVASAPRAHTRALRSFADLPPAARTFVTTFYPKGTTKPERRVDVAQQLLATLNEGACLNGQARRILAFSDQRLNAKCEEVLASPPRKHDAAIVVLLKKLADTSDGSAPGHRAEATAAGERQDDERTGAQRTALAEAWLLTQPEIAAEIENLLNAEKYPTDPRDPTYAVRSMMRRQRAIAAWSKAGEPQVQHA